MDYVWFPNNWSYSLLNTDFVLHILEPEPEGEIGGADMHVYNLSLQQNISSFLKPLVLINQNNKYSEILKQAGIPHVQCNLLRGKKLMLLKYLKNLPKKINIKILHSHQYDANYLTVLLKRFFPKTWGSIPTIMTCHGWVENTIRDKIKTLLDFYTYKYSNTIIIAAKKDERRLDVFKYTKYIKYIPNGVVLLEEPSIDEVNKFKNRFSIPSDKKLVGIVGRLAFEKRIDVFLHACREVIQNANNVHFIVAGSGREEKKLKKLCEKLKIDQYVCFPGLVYEIGLVFSAIDILVLTSSTETTPRVILEAMSMGKPIIATNVGGLPEMIEHNVNGLLVSDGDYIGISKYILLLLKNDQMGHSLGKSARDKYIEKFTILTMQQSIDEVYKYTIVNNSL